MQIGMCRFAVVVAARLSVHMMPNSNIYRLVSDLLNATTVEGVQLAQAKILALDVANTSLAHRAAQAASAKSAGAKRAAATVAEAAFNKRVAPGGNPARREPPMARQIVASYAERARWEP